MSEEHGYIIPRTSRAWASMHVQACSPTRSRRVSRFRVLPGDVRESRLVLQPFYGRNSSLYDNRWSMNERKAESETKPTETSSTALAHCEAPPPLDKYTVYESA